MGSDRALLAQADAPQRRSGVPVAGEPRRTQWHPVGLTDRRPVGGLAGPVSVVPDLPSAVPALVRCGVLKDILSVLAEALHDEGYLDLLEAFIDGSFAPAKKLIAPHRRNRTRRTQDGRPLRRYRRRWKMERLFAWLQNYRRIVVRYERYPENFLGMLHLACWLILLWVFMR
jgi:hypothetical protein